MQGETRKTLLSIGQSRIHFAFLDAEHTEKDVISEYNYVSNIQKSGDIIVFDDVTPDTFPGVVKAINYIEKLGKYKVQEILSSKKRGYAVAIKI